MKLVTRKRSRVKRIPLGLLIIPLPKEDLEAGFRGDEVFST